MYLWFRMILPHWSSCEALLSGKSWLEHGTQVGVIRELWQGCQELQILFDL